MKTSSFQTDVKPPTSNGKRQVDLKHDRHIVGMSSNEVAMTAGVAVFVGLLFVGLTSTSDEQAAVEVVEEATKTVLSSAVPNTATDVFSLVLGEGAAGSIGAVINAGLGVLISLVRSKGTESASEDERRKIYSNALAEGDFFFSRAAALPLLESVGLSSSLATITAVLIATIPYEIIKINEQRRRQQNEDTSNLSFEAEEPFEIDWVDLFVDTTKWLEYTVLSNDFNGMLLPGRPILESSAFGFVSATSSRFYADVVLFFYNRKNAKEESSKILDPVDYLSLGASGAALFGVYESLRLPVSRFFQSVLTGGVDNCLGSTEFDVCIETFRIDNPLAQADAEAQIRALFTAIHNLLDRVGFFGNGENFSGVDVVYPEYWEGNVRSIAVSLYSILGNFLPLY